MALKGNGPTEADFQGWLQDAVSDGLHGRGPEVPVLAWGPSHTKVAVEFARAMHGRGISCLERAAPDEPLFVLRAKDRLAPEAVRQWIGLCLAANTATPPEARPAPGVLFAKLEEARKVAEQMEGWQREHGSKLPD